MYLRDLRWSAETSGSRDQTWPVDVYSARSWRHLPMTSLLESSAGIWRDCVVGKETVSGSQCKVGMA